MDNYLKLMRDQYASVEADRISHAMTLNSSTMQAYESFKIGWDCAESYIRKDERKKILEMIRSERNKKMDDNTVLFNWGADLAAKWLESKWNELGPL